MDKQDTATVALAAQHVKSLRNSIAKALPVLKQAEDVLTREATDGR